VQRIRAASLEALAQVPGISLGLAAQIKSILAEPPAPPTDPTPVQDGQ
jgi:hypothetical protein